MDSRVFKQAVDRNTEAINQFKELYVSHQHLYCAVRIPKDSAAGDEWEGAIITAPYDCNIKEVKVVPDGDIGQATDFMTLNVLNKGADGSGTTNIGSRAVNSVNTIDGFVGVDVLTEEVEVSEGHSLSLQKDVGETSGQVWPGGLVIVKYEKA